MVSPFAIFVFIVAAVMIVSTVIQFHRKQITPVWAMFWTGIWIIGSVMTYFTGFLDRIGQAVIGNTGNQLVVYTAIVVLMVVVYRLFLDHQQVKKDISKLVEELAKKK